MKKSISRRLTNKLFRLINIKSLYENEKFSEHQIKQSTKDVKPALTHRARWKKYTVNEFAFFEGKSKLSEKIIIYFHGGGFISQPNIFHWSFLKRLQEKTKAKIFVPIYPKIPFYNYKDCYAFLFEFLTKIKPKFKNKEVIFMGDSAGGNIALSFSLQIEDLEISKNILFSPCLDLTLSNPKIEEIEKAGTDVFLSIKGLKRNYKKWAKDTKLSNEILSPINANLKKLVPTTIFVGSNEILLPEILDFYEKAKKANKKIEIIVGENQSHAYPLHPFKESKESVRKTIKLINE